MQLPQNTFAASKQSILALPVTSFFPRKCRKSSFLTNAWLHLPHTKPQQEWKTEEKENTKKLRISTVHVRSYSMI